MAYIDNGNRFLEGEKKGYSGAYAALQASYQHKGWQFSLTWGNPLTKNYKSSGDEILKKPFINLQLSMTGAVAIALSLAYLGACLTARRTSRQARQPTLETRTMEL